LSKVSLVETRITISRGALFKESIIVIVHPNYLEDSSTVGVFDEVKLLGNKVDKFSVGEIGRSRITLFTIGPPTVVVSGEYILKIISGVKSEKLQ
jgi:hypothetical protein